MKAIKNILKNSQLIQSAALSTIFCMGSMLSKGITSDQKKTMVQKIISQKQGINPQNTANITSEQRKTTTQKEQPIIQKPTLTDFQRTIDSLTYVEKAKLYAQLWKQEKELYNTITELKKQIDLKDTRTWWQRFMDYEVTNEIRTLKVQRNNMTKQFKAMDDQRELLAIALNKDMSELDRLITTNNTDTLWQNIGKGATISILRNALRKLNRLIDATDNVIKEKMFYEQRMNIRNELEIVQNQVEF